MGQIPALGLRFAIQFRGDLRWRMGLQAQSIAAVQPLDQNREGLGRIVERPHDLGRVLLQQFAQGLAGLDADGLSLGPVNHIPGLPDGVVAGQFPAKLLRQPAPPQTRSW